MVSADNYTKKGKSDKSEMFSGGYFFIDHASGYMSIKHQVSINYTETLKAKLTFEREDKNQGVMINVYHTDIFNTSKFMEKLLKKQQKLRLSGAGASHKNGAGSRLLYQDSDQYGKCHIDASLDDMSQENIIHWFWPTEMDYDVWI